MKRILVTGGFGFIGSHLVDRLLQEGHAVHVVDNLSTNPIRVQTLMEELGFPRELTCSIYPISEYRQVAAFDDKGERKWKFDEIYHLASPVGPAGLLPHAGNILRQITDDTYAIIKLALQNEARMIDVSSSEVYGGGKDGLCSEAMPSVIQADSTARLEYAIAKRAAEVVITNHCKYSGLNAAIVRPFNVAGPRQSGKGGFVLPRFVAQAMRDEPITVFGDGKQVRAFTHVKDIVQGLILAMEQGKGCEVYNLGNPANKTTVLELAEQVKSIVGGGTITFTDGKSVYGERFAEANDKYPDASKATRDLNWKPEIDIKQTITDVWKYMARMNRLEWLAGDETVTKPSLQPELMPQ
jgi:UDP-glucose 4-epimerase